MLAARQREFIAVLIDHKHLAFPNLINLSGSDTANEVLVLVVEQVLLQFEDLGCQGLAQVEDSATTELLEMHFFGEVLADFDVIDSLTSFAERYLKIGVGEFVVGHYFAVLVDFEVTLVGVDDDVEVLVGAEHLGQYRTE